MDPLGWALVVAPLALIAIAWCAPWFTPRFPRPAAEAADMPSVRDFTTADVGSGLTITCNTPTVADDDVLVVWITHTGGNAVYSTPSGWTAVPGSTWDTGGQVHAAFTRHVADAASEPSDHTFTSDDSDNQWAAMVSVEDADTADPLDDFDFANIGTPPDTDANLSVDTTADDCLLLGFAGTDQSALTTWSSNMETGGTELFDVNGSSDNNNAGYAETVGAAGTYNRTITHSVSDEFGALLLAIAPAGAVSGSTDQANYRIRADDSQTVNADAGWAAALNTAATIDLEHDFGVRFEVAETAGTNVTDSYRLQYRHRPDGGSFGAWTNVPTETGGPGNAATLLVGLVPSANVTDGAATTNVLSGSGATFVAGTAETGGPTPSVTNSTGSVSLTSQHTEFEFRLRLHKFADGRLEARPDDTIELRLTTSTGGSLTAYTNTPSVTVGASVGVIGGAYAEGPNHCGPFVTSTGRLVVLAEYAETESRICAAISDDGGDTWTEATAAGRPTFSDLESVDGRMDGDVLRFVAQGVSSDSVWYFELDCASTPPVWDVIDEVVAASANPTEQACSIEVRGDGTVVAGWVGIATQDHPHYRIRSAGGTWGTPVVVGSGDGATYRHITSLLDADGVVHFFYYRETDNSIRHRTLSTGDVLSGEDTVVTGLSTSANDRQPIVPPITYERGNGDVVVVVAYKTAADRIASKFSVNGGAWSSEALASGTTVEHNSGGSGQPAASLAVNGTDWHLLYSDLTTLDLFRDVNADGAGWGTDTEELDGYSVHWVRSEVFTHSAGNGGGHVLGMFIDNGSNGGAGQGIYREFAVTAPSTDITAVTADATADAPAAAVTAAQAAAVTGVVAAATGDAPAATVTAGQSATVAAASADATADAPTAAVSAASAAAVTATPADATADAPAATVTAAQAAAVAAEPADATGDAPAPAVQADTTVTATPADATCDAPPPAVTADRVVTVTATPADAVGDAPPPTLAGGLTITAPAAEATADMPAGGEVHAAIEVEAEPADATADAPAATLAGGITIPAEPADATGDAPAAAVTADRSVTVAAVAASAVADAAEPVVTSAATTIVQAVAATATADAPASTVHIAAAITAAVADATGDAPAPLVLAAWSVDVEAAAADAYAAALAPLFGFVTYPAASFLDTTRRYDRFTGTIRPDRIIETASHNRLTTTARDLDRFHPTARPDRFTGTIRYDRATGTIRYQRVHTTRIYREDADVALNVVPLGDLTQGEIPEGLLIQWVRTHNDETTSGMPLHGQTPAFTVTAKLEQPSGGIVSRACTILDPADLSTLFPDEPQVAPFVDGTEGWVLFQFDDGDLDELPTDPSTYELQLVAAQSTTPPIRLKTADKWTLAVNDGPAAAVGA